MPRDAQLQAQIDRQPENQPPDPKMFPCSRCGVGLFATQACSGVLVAGWYCGACWVEYGFPEEQRRLACLAGHCP